MGKVNGDEKLTSFTALLSAGESQINMPALQLTRMERMESGESFSEYSDEAYRYNLGCSCDFDDDFDNDSCGTESSSIIDDDDESGFTVTSLQSQCSVEIRPMLRFNDYVRVRECAVTVGDTAYSEDSCPMTLDWCFVESEARIKNEPDKPTAKYGVRWLTIEQRRRRIAHVQGWTNQSVNALEIDRVLQCMEDVMQRQEVFLDSLIEHDADNQEDILSFKKEKLASKTDICFESLRDWDGVHPIKKTSSESCLMNASQRMEDMKIGLDFADN